MFFSGKSFMHWSRNIKIALITKKKLGFINGTYPKPAETHANYNDWIRTDYMVMRWLLHSLSVTISESLSYVTSSKQLWEELNERFNQSNVPHLYQLRKEVTQIFQGDSFVAEYYSKLRIIWEDMRSLKPLPECSCGVLATCTCNLLKKIVERDNKNNLIDFPMGLDRKYEHLRGQILAMDPLPSVNQAFAKVHQAEVQKKITISNAMIDMDSVSMVASQHHVSDHHSVGGYNNAANTWKKDAKRPKLERFSYHCDFCNKAGHTQDFCWKLKNQKSKNGTQSLKSASSGGRRFAANVEEVHEFEAASPCDPPRFQSSDFPVDSTFVQAVAKELFKLQNAAASHSLSVADHMSYDLYNFKTYRLLSKPLTVVLPDGQTKVVKYGGEIELTDRLLLTNVLYLPDFKHNLLSLGRLLDDSDLTAHFSSSGCYIQALSTKAVLCTGWRSAGIYRFSTRPLSTACFPNSCSIFWSASVSLNDVHLLHARLGHVSFSTLKHVVSNAKIPNNTDGFHCETCLLAKHHKLPFPGIVHQRSIPGNPQQNGKVERKHRHLLETARALRIQSFLPKRFWGEMVLAATHLINLMPTKTLGWKTPHETLFKRAPDYSSLRTIGCLCFAAQNSGDKFENRVVKCIMLGYPFAKKGYKLYNLTDHKILLSRDVIFNENTFPYNPKYNVQCHTDVPILSKLHSQLPVFPDDAASTLNQNIISTPDNITFSINTNNFQNDSSDSNNSPPNGAAYDDFVQPLVSAPDNAPSRHSNRARQLSCRLNDYFYKGVPASILPSNDSS
ncbi:hypothetical protein RND81_02G209700 [Saponaria officinalis]|uniref:Integrase catalytic domain-containing protein n=1 Tax=Saponaria officinalis TaxID=3572 RepID=A0AAW1MX80_SAPOF